MISPDSRPASRAFLLPLVLLVAAAAFRWAKLKGYVTFEVLENFTPWMALAFTGTLVFSKRVHFLLIPLLLVLIDASATGLRSVLLQTGAGGGDGKFPATPDFRTAGLREAVRLILARS